MANGNRVFPSVVQRVCSYVISAEMSGADLVIITCSSISGLADIAARLVEIPVMKIDDPMAELAVKRGRRIKVLATLSTTLTPSVRLIQEKASQQGKAVFLDPVLCEKARQFLDRGNPEMHDRILRKEIEDTIDNYDLIVLAQASMGRVLDTLDSKKANRVLTSPKIAVDYLRRRLLSGQ